MPTTKGGSRALLRTMRTVMAAPGDGQQRLDKIVRLVASNMVAEVCSVYLKRDERTLELCATEGLRADAVHSARLLVGQGLVGRIAERAEPFATDDAQNAQGYRYLPETGEERFRSFVGVPIQRVGEVMGVLVVQNEASRQYHDDEIEALEVIAMVIAEMTEAGAFLGTDGLAAGPGRRVGPVLIEGVSVCEGTAEGVAHLHDPRLVVFNPIAEDPLIERARLNEAIDTLRSDADRLLASQAPGTGDEQRDIFHAYRMFAYDKGWTRRLHEAVDSGLAAEVAVEKVQSDIRARMERATDRYLRERLHDLDELANRLLRYLTGGKNDFSSLPHGAVLIARNLGPIELMDHSGRIAGVVLEEGSLTSHAAIVARALAIPMVIQAERITRDVNPGDRIVVDGDQGRVHLRPDLSVLDSYREKIEIEREARAVYRNYADQPARSRDGKTVRLKMNAGVLADLPSLEVSGAEGVGLYRTELQFMIRQRMPGREAQAALYSRILDAAGDKSVTFRTLDIGSDKILPYMRREREPNPALGWRAIRVGLDRPKLFRMQIQALIRGANGRALSLMFPMVTEAQEYYDARALVEGEIARLAAMGHRAPATTRIGAMLEIPALAFASDQFFRDCDFISVGGNDLMQFFFAADRENQRVHKRYDMLNYSFLNLLRRISERCEDANTPLCFCGEAAGRRLEALVLAAMGFNELSMRPISIGPVKQALRATDLGEVLNVLARGERAGASSARAGLIAWAQENKLAL